MKRRLLFGALFLLLCGCTEDVTVMSSDGSLSLGVCVSDPGNGRYMVPCLRTVCPSGLTVLPNADRAPLLIRCLPSYSSDAGLE
jgi:hypothetical protein